MIITLGEGIIGTVASLNAVVHGEAGLDGRRRGRRGRRESASYSGCGGRTSRSRGRESLVLHRERRSLGVRAHRRYSPSLAAIGAGLHVAAYYIEHETAIGATGRCSARRSRSRSTSLALYAHLHGVHARAPIRSTSALLAGTAAVLALVGRWHAGVSVAVCLARAHARAGGDGRRLRDARAPPRRGGAPRMEPRTELRS